MKFLLSSLVAVLLIVGLGPGCGHVDLTPEGNRRRVLTGTLNVGVALPAGAEIMVRIVATGGAPAQPSSGDIPVTKLEMPATEQVLGEQVQTLAVAAADPVPFKIEYEAEDAVLRRGINLEARVYYNGRVRFRTVNAHVVTINSAHFPQTLVLKAAER